MRQRTPGPLGIMRPMLGLKTKTDPAWVEVALSDELALLRDHAHLERKAAGHCITLMGQLERAETRLLEVAREELEHFERVCGILERRGEELKVDLGNKYVQELAKATGRSLLDRTLRMGLIEARSYEHFELLSQAASGELGQLYEDLKESEAGHHAFFISVAYEHWPREQVKKRWDELTTAESEILANIEWGPRIH